jgi:hypothetical protein
VVKQRDVGCRLDTTLNNEPRATVKAVELERNGNNDKDIKQMSEMVEQKIA